MAYHVELSRRAELDLRNIFDFIYTDRSIAAERWFFGLEDQIQRLSMLADRGTITDYDSKLRYILYGNKPHLYRVLYRIDSALGIVKIVHIRHGARKPIGGRQTM
jgi:toxin ParE1/3/4